MCSPFPRTSFDTPWGIAIAAILSVIFFLLGIVITNYSTASDRQHCDTAFHLLNARRRCEKDEPPKKQEYDELVSSLLWRITEWQKNHEASHITVYFRDLENGPLFGIHEDERFAPASLLKVPIMMALLKYAELHPEILEEELGIGENIPAGQNIFDPDQTLLPNKLYPVSEILRRMIVYSDNAAKEVLLRRMEALSPGIIQQTFIDLGIVLQNPDGSAFITVKSYASLFRILFNASYLNRDSSQKALTILSQVEFDDGIVAGVPKGTVVAHKFGFLNPDPDEQQLHDCGIVYHPKMPYLLCVMTRGSDSDTIDSVIGKISEMVYNEVSLQNTGE